MIGDTKKQVPRTPSSRNPSLDVIRVAGTILIVAGHVWSENAELRSVVYLWHVPIFFFLTGYLWRDDRTLREEWRRRTRTLVWPYLSWLAIIGLPYFSWLIISHPEIFVSKALRTLWGGAAATRPFSAFWFVTALITAVLILRAFRSRAQWLPTTIAVVVLMANYYFDIALDKSPLAITLAIPCIIFVVSGRIARQFLRYKDLPLGLPVTVIAVAIAASLLSRIQPLDIKAGDFGTPVVSVLAAIGVCASLVVIAEKSRHMITTKAQTVVSRLASGCFLVVLTHAAILQILGTPVSGGWIDFAAAVFIPWAAALTIAYTPLSTKLLGTERVAASPTKNAAAEGTKTGE